VNNNTFKVILVVLIRNNFVIDDKLILIKIFQGPVMLFHLFDKILSTYVFLTVLCHIKIYREITCIIKLNLVHGIIVKLKSLENYKQAVRKSFDGATFKGITFLVTLFTEISIITFKHLSFNKLF